MQSDEKGYAYADAFLSVQTRIYEELISGSLGPESMAARETLLRQSVGIGLVEHWKSTDEDWKFYPVFGVQFDVESKVPPSVSYAAVYGDNAGKLGGRDLLDPEYGFLSPIRRSGGLPFSYIGPRFVWIRRLSWSQAARLAEQADEIKRQETRTEALRYMFGHVLNFKRDIPR